MKSVSLFFLVLSLAVPVCPAQIRAVSIGAFGLFRPSDLEVQTKSPALLEFQSGLDSTSQTLLPGQVLRLRWVSGKIKVGIREPQGRLVYETVIDCLQGHESVYTLQVARKIERNFRGRLVVTAGQDQLLPRLVVPEETATEQVLRSEMESCRHREALKAQAILIRSYLRSSRGRHGSEGYDYCDTTHCQFFTGFVENTDLFDEAVASTRGLVLTFLGKPFQPLYTAACGGQTLASKLQQSGSSKPLSRYPYRTVVCTYCRDHPLYRWENTLDRQQFQRIVLKGEMGTLESVFARLGQLDEATDSEQEFKRRVRLRIGRQLGWKVIPSDLYSMDASGDPLKIHGRGSGHNLGLCQAGAISQAVQGRSCAEIVEYYFPGCLIQ